MESDIQGLNKVSADLSLSRTDLEIQVKELTKDLDLLKKEHQEVRKCSEAVSRMIEMALIVMGGGGVKKMTTIMIRAVRVQ